MFFYTLSNAFVFFSVISLVDHRREKQAITHSNLFSKMLIPFAKNFICHVLNLIYGVHPTTLLKIYSHDFD